MIWPIVKLRDVATIDRIAVDPSRIPCGVKYLGLEHIDRGGTINGWFTVGETAVASTKFKFDRRQVLYGKLRPNLGKIARPQFDGVCSTDILPITPGPRLDRDYLHYYLAQESTIDYAASRASGANLPRLSPDQLLSFELPLPPIEEQLRIAAILDQADALSAKRRQVLINLDDLTQAVFVNMFAHRRWEEMPFDELVTGMRNGVSPSKGGSVEANVLTLSAITSGAFNPGAQKVGMFVVPPPVDSRISTADLLICRGNGNLHLVGSCAYSTIDIPALVFPDTVIAATVNTAKTILPFVSIAWRQQEVRRQIEASARTTSGIHKVNQSTLGAVRVPVPPITLQIAFADRLVGINKQRAIAQTCAESADALFKSLKTRAFAEQL